MKLLFICNNIQPNNKVCRLNSRKSKKTTPEPVDLDLKYTSYAEKRQEELKDLEVCPKCGGIIFRCFPDGSGKCGDCGIIYPNIGEVL